MVEESKRKIRISSEITTHPQGNWSRATRPVLIPYEGDAPLSSYFSLDPTFQRSPPSALPHWRPQLRKATLGDTVKSPPHHGSSSYFERC